MNALSWFIDGRMRLMTMSFSKPATLFWMREEELRHAALREHAKQRVLAEALRAARRRCVGWRCDTLRAASRLQARISRGHARAGRTPGAEWPGDDTPVDDMPGGRAAPWREPGEPRSTPSCARAAARPRRTLRAITCRKAAQPGCRRVRRAAHSTRAGALGLLGSGRRDSLETSIRFLSYTVAEARRPWTCNGGPANGLTLKR